METTGKDNPDKFHTSEGWFEKLKNHSRLWNSRLTGEEEPLNAQLARKYSKQLQKLVRARGYVPQQVLNAKDMSLFGKWMPLWTFREKGKKSETLEEAKERILLCVCVCVRANAIEWQKDKTTAAL